jgi:hypothetical protein
MYLNIRGTTNGFMYGTVLMIVIGTAFELYWTTRVGYVPLWTYITQALPHIGIMYSFFANI